MCVAFASGGTGYDGTTFAGSADGYILRFTEQATDLQVKAHPLESNELCKVTALYFDPAKHVLISSGDDGYLRMWDPAKWGRGADIKPIRAINFNAWVTPELKGITIKMDDKELEKANPKRGKPAAAHSLFGDGRGNILVGTVCNEIYEVSFEQSDPPFCYMQGHYEELWGHSTHPSKLEFCTGVRRDSPNAEAAAKPLGWRQPTPRLASPLSVRVVCDVRRRKTRRFACGTSSVDKCARWPR